MKQIDKVIRKEMSEFDKETLEYYINVVGMPEIVGKILIFKWVYGLSNVEIAYKVGYQNAETISRKITYGVNKFKKAIKRGRIDFPECYKELLEEDDS